MKSKSYRWGLWVLPMLALAQLVHATLPMETETANSQPRHGFEGEMAFEYQVSSDGSEMALPMAWEYGLLDNIELLLEPVLYTAILPNTGTSHIGFGDLEATLNWRCVDEGQRLPAFAFAVEHAGTGRWQWVAEVLGNSPIGSGSTVAENPVVPEAAGGELVGTVGVRYFFLRNAALAFGASYDNSQALQSAPGLIVAFH